jgi:hypothetical protein
MKISRPEMIHFIEFRNTIALLSKWGALWQASNPRPGDSRLQAGPETLGYDIALDAENTKRLNFR